MLDHRAVRKWREGIKLSQGKLAKQIGMSLNAYNSFERGLTARMLPVYEERLEALMGGGAVPEPNGGSSGTRTEHRSHVSVTSTQEWRLLAGELRQLADWLDASTVPDDLKYQKFQITVNSFAAALNQFLIKFKA